MVEFLTIIGGAGIASVPVFLDVKKLSEERRRRKEHERNYDRGLERSLDEATSSIVAEWHRRQQRPRAT